MPAPHSERARTPGWRAGPAPPVFDPVRITAYSRRIREPLHVVADGQGDGTGVGVATGGEITASGGDWRLAGVLPPLYPEWLGDRAFTAADR